MISRDHLDRLIKLSEGPFDHFDDLMKLSNKQELEFIIGLINAWPRLRESAEDAFL